MWQHPQSFLIDSYHTITSLKDPEPWKYLTASRAMINGCGQQALIETFKSTGVRNKMKKDKTSGDLWVNGVRGGHFDCLNYVFQVTGNDRWDSSQIIAQVVAPPPFLCSGAARRPRPAPRLRACFIHWFEKMVFKTTQYTDVFSGMFKTMTGWHFK